MDFVLNSVFWKIFVSKSYDVVNECITFLNCLVYGVCKRKIQFLTKLQYSENIICRLFEKKLSGMN